ncbi:MAG: hypothetical protein JXB13_18060 [Phycisphaerae bacterium]|nr:hypothetical protein [Phycisphaerae bacterium]
MKSPAVYDEVAAQLAMLCQTLERETWTRFTGTAWLPRAVRDFEPSYGRVSPDGCQIEMGGGFFHFGYSLVRDESASTAEENVWQLRFREESGSELLTTVTLNVTERWSEEEFVESAMAGFDELIAANPGIFEPYRSKFYFLLTFDHRDRARQVCADATGAMPGHWWPRLTAAMMDSAGPAEGEASERFESWVEANPSLGHYVYLSYFHDVAGRRDAACRAALTAVKQPFVDGAHDSSNCWFLSYTAAVIAFRNGCYETVIEVADRALRASDSDSYLYYDFLGMQAAAWFLLGELDRADAVLGTARPPSADSRCRDGGAAAFGTLRKAIRDKDAEAVRAWVSPEAGEFHPHHDLPIEKVRGVGAGVEQPGRDAGLPEA